MAQTSFSLSRMETESTVQHQLEILSGWKDVASYMGMGVRTVQRYERHQGLPIRRPAGNIRASILAVKNELDAWVIARPVRETLIDSPCVRQRALE